MEPIQTFSGKMVALPIDNIDTDQIIPARYLKATDKAGMGEALFSDWRRLPDGSPNPDFVLNRPEAQGAQVLIAGHNFGCGSSREHAPWALTSFGFKAVVSTFFADIFRSNALKNGLLPIMVDAEIQRKLLDMCDEMREPQITIDLANQTLILPDGTSVQFPIDAFSKYCLLNGVDELGFLMKQEEEAKKFEASHPVSVNTTAPAAV